MHCTYSKTNNQHAGQPDRNPLVLSRLAYRFLTLSLMVTAPPCPPISVQSHTGKTTREEVMREDQTIVMAMALVQLMHPIDHGRQVCYKYNISLVPYIYTFLLCPARPSAAPKHHPSFPPQPLHASSHAASHLSPTRQDHPAHLQKGTNKPYWSPHYAICYTPRLFLHIPQTQSATNTYPRDTAVVTRRRLLSDVCCCFSA
jgi:hypothetical protein